jgi:hypothetical protein
LENLKIKLFWKFWAVNIKEILNDISRMNISSEERWRKGISLKINA